MLTSPNDSFSAPLGNLYPASVEESGRKRKKPEESIFLLIDGTTSSTAHLCSDELYFQDFTICAFETEPRAKEPLEGKLQNSVETCRQPFISTSSVSKIFAPSMRIILALHFIAIKEVVPPLPHFFRISCPFHVDFLLCFISI